MILLGIVGVVTVITALFWAVIFAIWYERFYTVPIEEKSPADEERDQAWKMRCVLHDLKNNVIKLTAFDKLVKALLKAGKADTKALADLGLAENKTVAAYDRRNVFEGDSWLCDNRPVWFAAIQIVLASLLALFISLFSGEVLWTSLVAWIVTTGGIALLSYEVVEERTRLSVQRFGRQLDGFLGPGLQFVLPGIELLEGLTLQNLVWQPLGDQPLSEELSRRHLTGSLGKSNPSPGIIKVEMIGWPALISVSVNLRVGGTKDAWKANVLSFINLDELGRRIAQIVSAVVEALALEVSQIHRAKSKDPAKRAEAAYRSLILLAQQVPEMAGTILTALVASNELGGMLVTSVAIVGIDLDPKFLELRQSLDRAFAQLSIEKDTGAARVLAFDQYLTFLRGINVGTDPLLRDQTLRLIELELQRSIIGVSGGNPSIPLTLSITHNATKGTP